MFAGGPVSNYTINAMGEEQLDNTSKLVVLTIIIFFTVVGNFGVILAILLRRCDFQLSSYNKSFIWNWNIIEKAVKH